jgi:hypothetical protein
MDDGEDNMYTYKPLRFYLVVFALTWGFWISAIFTEEKYRFLLMLLGLFVPAVTAAVTVLTSKNAMTQTTKCVETVVLFAAAAIRIAPNKELFFEKRHIGRLLEETHG